MDGLAQTLAELSQLNKFTYWDMNTSSMMPSALICTSVEQPTIHMPTKFDELMYQLSWIKFTNLMYQVMQKADFEVTL